MQQIYELNRLLLSYELNVKAAADVTTAREAEHADDGPIKASSAE